MVWGVQVAKQSVLQLVEETIKRGNLLSKTLSLTDRLDDISSLAGDERVESQDLQ